MSQQRIQTVEMRIARKLVQTLIAAGFTISVWDGEAYAICRASKVSHVMCNLRTTDNDVLHLRKGGMPAGFVSLVYGNDGYDVISDNSVSLENVLSPVTAYAETFAS